MGADAATRAVSKQGFLKFAKLLGSTLTSQIILSASSLLLGLLLIRYTDDLQYGYYILASSAILLLTSLHSAFLQAPIVIGVQSSSPVERASLVGDVYQEQRRVLHRTGIVAALLLGALWYAGVVEPRLALLILVTLIAAVAALQRNFFRLVLLAHRRPHDVLYTDIGFVILLMFGVFLAIRAPDPSTGSMLAIGIASAAGALLAARALWQLEPWKPAPRSRRLRDFAPLAAWSAAGAAVHWSFSQGYAYLAANALDVSAVAAIAATRLTMMPVNLLSTGIAALMLPITIGWLRDHRPSEVLRRLAYFALGIATVALGYFIVLWLGRDWLFANVLRKDFANRDLLLMLWAAVFLVMTARDQLIYLLVARQRFKQLTIIGTFSAIISLTACYLGMISFGVVGAPLGVLIGELINLCGVTALSLRHASTGIAAPACAEAT